jgi:hypothetical protein
VNTVRNFRFANILGSSYLAEKPAATEERFGSMELVTFALIAYLRFVFGLQY